MSINVIAVGKMKKEFLSLNDLYLKRCGFFSKIKIDQLKDASIEKESENIIKKLTENSRKILFAPDGKTVKNSRYIASLLKSYSNLTFIIGGAEGVGESVKKRCNEIISVSNLIFPHQLFRIIVLEQIYRGFCINNNHPYHKE
ncbi:MAG: 23S rRNA (pseudouridine(1915)-N(3))-methyltransferase RlmH [Candidatus Muiribacterium halophilum]|mgnify:CR=1 FL=1|uniref:Ribosomal RNA large subunit methyltransferase H n=1 Tax=Muiribacterium halophilum TaxID=2053465 RepID=A0A2N5ZBG5_MUIH1|nr:MAG: 23S rRNA (pseudouridine(1915)-N(3))-methyltransferase RlmH [Candidatus Muirbacterium halophilum]